MGWLMCKKHPDVMKFGKRVDMSDLEADPHIMFQHKHYISLVWVASAFIPILVPWLFWNESFVVSFFFSGVTRLVISHHSTWLINSAAHFFGMKPFDG
jgi:stearoyl-CoA desaturase (Delta-9 desaturase)